MDTSLAGSGVTDTVGFVIDVADENVDLATLSPLLCFDGRGLTALAAGCATGVVEVIFTRDDVSDTIRILALGKIRRR